MEQVFQFSWLVISVSYLIFVFWFFRNRKKDNRFEFSVVAFYVLLLSNPYNTDNFYLNVSKSVIIIIGLFYLIKLYFDLHRKIECIDTKKG